MLLKYGLIIWFCLGALGLGIVLLEASRRKKEIGGFWTVLAILLGPVFLCLILPLWLGRWGDKRKQVK